MEIEQVADDSTIEEMRAEINRLRRYDPVVCQALDTADFNGMSAEDRYTILSYFALKQKCYFHQQLLDLSAVYSKPLFVVKGDE